MARISDPAKLENIKQATVSMIVEKGYGGASISAIAAKAGVADGYLYRHYPGKTELVRDLFNESTAMFFDYLRQELENYTTFTDFITRYHRGLVDLINEKTDHAKFFIQLINDFTFEIDETAKQSVLDLCHRTLERGQRNHEIPDTCSPLDIYTVIVIVPLQIFSLYLKGFFGKITLDEKTAAMVTHTCLKLIRPS
ncbi:MAG: TetR/AcrR family transcriptional regulator [Bacteroidales bacterium]|nr:TetR/AcrR family transcriptional regulator [Bacteroidales bacterium]